MDYGKYIVLNSQHILIFDPAMSHKEVAAGFLGNNKVTSAGFIVTVVGSNSDEVQISCYGRSVTLDICSQPDEDKQLAKFALGVH